MNDDLPQYVSWYTDRHNRRRYRYRKPGEPARSLPGEPGSPKFETAYRDAIAGKAKATKEAKRFEPRTLAAAWAQVKDSPEWRELKPISREQQTLVAERFLLRPVVPGAAMAFGQLGFAGINRGRIKSILGQYERPHSAEAVLRLLRKLCLVALDLEWIEHDPTHKIKFRPKIIGHRAWTDAEFAQFEARWPSGTPQRLAYAMALYTGQRRGDLAAMLWTALDGDWIAVLQEKTGAPLMIPVHPALRVEIDQAPRCSTQILTGPRGTGYARESFGNVMADWIKLAGLSDECRLHGLRKSAGRCLAEAGATTRMIMAVLGHKTIKEAEHYTRQVEQKMMAQQGMDQWARPKLKIIK